MLGLVEMRDQGRERVKPDWMEDLDSRKWQGDRNKTGVKRARHKMNDGNVTRPRSGKT